MKTFEILKARRRELNLTLHALGEKVGVSDGAIQRYETGYIKNIPYSRIIKLAEALEMKPTELLGFDEPDCTPKLPPRPKCKEIEKEKVKEGAVCKANEALELFVKMSALVEQGVLTQEEYCTMKQKIISEI